MVVEHAHWEREGDLKGGIVQVWWWSAACVEGAYWDGGGEDQGGNVTGKSDDGGRDGGGLSAHVCDVICDRSRGHGHREVAIAVGGVNGNDVGCLDCRVWLYDVACIDEGGGYGGGVEGERRRQIGVL